MFCPKCPLLPHYQMQASRGSTVDSVYLILLVLIAIVNSKETNYNSRNVVNHTVPRICCKYIFSLFIFLSQIQNTPERIIPISTTGLTTFFLICRREHNFSVLCQFCSPVSSLKPRFYWPRLLQPQPGFRTPKIALD